MRRQSKKNNNNLKKNKNKKQNSKKKDKENLKDKICRKLQLKLPVTDRIQAANVTISPLFATKHWTAADFHQGTSMERL